MQVIELVLIALNERVPECGRIVHLEMCVFDEEAAELQQ